MVAMNIWQGQKVGQKEAILTLLMKKTARIQAKNCLAQATRKFLLNR